MTGTAYDDVLAALDVQEVGDGHYRAGHTRARHRWCSAGRSWLRRSWRRPRSVPGKDLRSVHTIFARGASLDEGLDIEVEPMADGRAVASATSPFVRAIASAAEHWCCSAPRSRISFVTVADAHRGRSGQPAAEPRALVELAWVGDVDIDDPALVGPPELPVWTRVTGSSDDPVVNQALLAYATDGFLIATAMRPHEGVGQALAHRSISTSVLSHTLTFHEPVDAGASHLLTESPYAGRGRAFGRAQVFTEDAGRLVA